MKNKNQMYIPSLFQGNMFLFLFFILSCKLFGDYFLTWNEKRANLVSIPDPIIEFFPTINTSVPIGIALYTSIIYYIYLAVYTNLVNIGVFYLSYIFLLICRALLIIAIPLKHHKDMVRLVDPIRVYIFGDHTNFDNDLAISGHASLLLLFAWTCKYTLFFYISLFVTVFFMLFSKVHYTIDFLNVPFIVFSCYSMATYFLSQVLHQQ